MLKAIKAGRIEPEPDATIDPARADAAWNANADATRRRTAVKEVEREEQPAAPARTPSLKGGASVVQRRLARPDPGAQPAAEQA